MTEKLIFEQGSEGRKGYSLPPCDVPERKLADLIPEEFLRENDPELPEVSEIETVRHFTKLSTFNHGVDTGFYPLGSCTMKYNPKITEELARLEGFARLHPYQPEDTVQGALELMYNLGEDLAKIAGMDKTTLQPAAGAHGEMTGMMIIRAYHQHRGDSKRTKVIVPDTAHGTNPATAAMVGFKAVKVDSNSEGEVNIEALKKLVDEETAALMLTNPNTLGLFEKNILEIADIVHEAGGLLYYDGANANAIMGYARPGDMGFDVIHFNLHKTFSTPHGGGGPGSGPVAVKEFLAPYLPKPVIEKSGEGNYYFNYDLPHSIGKVKSFYGNFGVMVKAYAYIKALGAEGLKEVSENAVLNANYLRAKLRDVYHIPYDRICKHEFIATSKYLKEYGVKTLDVAKRLLDYGYHPPTIYFPLIVEETMMIEPTETETKETLDEFVETLKTIAEESKNDPQLVKEAPHDTVVRRLDETTAARNPVIRWEKEK
ncbi:MAG: glycine dehydrogenase subunit 2 [Clostridia bacterium]|nr:Glycine dehydrogenase (decarboxylating) [Clostridiales bacterium]MDK2985565.1 glycine dehydrogenase subunit 2 [Clostridia bacterium]